MTSSTTPRLSVLMVTGVYAPETSGASLQCRSLIRALRDRVDFTVLTTTTDPGRHGTRTAEANTYDTQLPLRVRLFAGFVERPRA